MLNDSLSEADKAFLINLRRNPQFLQILQRLSEGVPQPRFRKQSHDELIHDLGKKAGVDFVISQLREGK